MLIFYRVYRVYESSFYSLFVQNIQSFTIKKYSLYIVGEIRGAECLDMLQAMNTGHDGSLSTGHANSCQDMISRMETMVLMGMELPLAAIQSQIAAGVDILVHLGRLRDRSRRLLSMMELEGAGEKGIRLNPLYEFVEMGEQDGMIVGSWKKKGELIHKGKLYAAGMGG